MTANPVPLRTPVEDALLKLYPEIRGVLPGDATVTTLRADAFDAFTQRGLPHRRVEEWKYTDLRAHLRHAAPIARPADEAKIAAVPALFAADDVRRLVIANGSFVPSLSDLADLEEGVSIGSLEDALTTGDASVAASLSALGNTAAGNPGIGLNTAFMRGGVLIDIAAGVELSRPIEIAVITEGDAPQATYVRSLIAIGAGARATVYESFADTGDVANQTNAVTQLTIGDDAEVRFSRVISESETAVHVGTVDATLGARVKYDFFSAVLGGGFVRVQPFVTLKGAGAEIALRGITLVGGRRHADATLVVEHDAPGCTSRELFKAVVDDEARSVFQGKIVVPSHAQKTDGKMMSQSLLLSEGAEADAKPELEIFADDVICGHGATVGAIDEDLLFYLRARGIPKAEAEAMLILAFLGEAVDAAEDERLGAILMERSEAWLKARGRSIS
jgi:Fe-S cluster assembly protein SufD